MPYLYFVSSESYVLRSIVILSKSAILRLVPTVQTAGRILSQRLAMPSALLEAFKKDTNPKVRLGVGACRGND